MSKKRNWRERQILEKAPKWRKIWSSWIENCAKNSMPFECSGNVSTLPWIEFRSSEGGEWKTLTYPISEDLAPMEKKTPCGREMTLNSPLIRIRDYWNTIVNHEILFSISRDLRLYKKEEKVTLRAEPHKLMCCQAGDYVDIPTGALGRLMIFLPTMLPVTHTKHEGGDLLIDHHTYGGSLQKKFSFTDLGSGRLKAQWVLIFNGCEYKIEPMLRGHQFTLQYNIFADKNVKIPQPALTQDQPHAKDANQITDWLCRILTRKWPKQILGFGIVLEHNFYGEKLEPSSLYGDDKLLYQCCQESFGPSAKYLHHCLGNDNNMPDDILRLISSYVSFKFRLVFLPIGIQIYGDIADDKDTDSFDAADFLEFGEVQLTTIYVKLDDGRYDRQGRDIDHITTEESCVDGACDNISILFQDPNLQSSTDGEVTDEDNDSFYLDYKRWALIITVDEMKNKLDKRLGIVKPKLTR